MFHTEDIEIRTHTLCVNNFLWQSCCLWDNVDKNSRSRHTKDDNMVHAHCVLDNKGYRHILRIRNTSCFSTATMVLWMHLNVTLYVQCLSCIKSEWQKKHDFSKQDSRTDHTKNSPMDTFITGNQIISHPFVHVFHSTNICRDVSKTVIVKENQYLEDELREII